MRITSRSRALALAAGSALSFIRRKYRNQCRANASVHNGSQTTTIQPRIMIMIDRTRNLRVRGESGCFRKCCKKMIEVMTSKPPTTASAILMCISVFLSPIVQDEPRPLGAVGSGAWFGSFFTWWTAASSALFQSRRRAPQSHSSESHSTVRPISKSRSTADLLLETRRSA